MIKLREEYKAWAGELNGPLGIIERVKGMILIFDREENYDARKYMRIYIEVLLERIKELIQEGGD